MTYDRLPANDPRTVARDIPGISDLMFPQLTAGLVAYLNKSIDSCSGVEPIPSELIELSKLKHSMLFEVAYARGEQLLRGATGADWHECLAVATRRQRRHFDADIPISLVDSDKSIAEKVGRNLASILMQLEPRYPTSKMVEAPKIAGYQWIETGEGDFSVGTTLVEVKCTNKNFGAGDYRQVLMYWLLSYASAVEHGSTEWTKCVLLNPRLNKFIEFFFSDLVHITGAGRSKVEILELFSSIVGKDTLRKASELVSTSRDDELLG